VESGNQPVKGLALRLGEIPHSCLDIVLIIYRGGGGVVMVDG
jgi:hypothetical protein